MQTDSINSLPAISPSQASIMADLLKTILAAYREAVGFLVSCPPGDELKKARNRLFWGSRIGSRVDGVRDQNTVEQMLRRSVMLGYAKAAHVDAEGNNVYCFKLSPHYAGKGKSTYVRIGDLKDKGKLFTKNIEVAIDYNDVEDTEHAVLQAPDVAFLNCDIITVILTPDNKSFVDWFCGAPEKIWNQNNLHEIISPEGKFILDNVWIQLALDYDMRTFERKRRVLNERKKQHNKKQENVVTPHSPLTSVARALEVAVIPKAPTVTETPVAPEPIVEAVAEETPVVS